MSLDAPPSPATEPVRDVSHDVLVSVASQGAAKVVHLALNVVSTLAIIRYLAPAAYGRYVLVITLVTLLGLLVDFGLPKLAVREIAATPDDETEVLGTVMVLRLLLAVGAAALMQAVLAAMDAPGEVRLAGLVGSAVFLADAVLSVTVAFHVRVRQQFEAVVVLVAEAVETALVLWLISRGSSLVALVAAPAVGMAVGLGLAVRIARRRFAVRVRFARSRVGHLLRQAWPVGLAGIVGIVMLRVDSVMIALLDSDHAVGIYGAAFQPIEYLLVGTAVVVAVLLPLLARARHQGAARLASLHGEALMLVVGLALIVPAVLTVLAEPGVDLAYTSRYRGAVGPLQLLSLAYVGMAISVWQAHVLLAVDRQRATLAVNAIGLTVAVILNLALIPAWGPVGAAVATVVTAALTAIGTGLVLRRHVHAPHGPRMLGLGGLAACLAVSALWLTDRGVPALAAATVATGAYLFVAHRTRLLDLGALRAALGPEMPGAALPDRSVT